MGKVDYVPSFTPYIINTRSKVAAVAVIVFVVALILQLVALCTPGWAQTPSTQLGLFTYCGRLDLDIRTESIYDCAPIPWQWEDVHTRIHAVRATAIVSLLLVFLAAILAAIHLWVVSRQENIISALVALCLILSSLGVVTSIITSAVFGTSHRDSVRVPTSSSDHHHHMSYSFVMYNLGTGCLVVALVLVLVSVKSLTRTLLT